MANFKVYGNLNTMAGQIDATKILTYPTGGGQGNRIDIEAMGSNYIRYGNGVQICWGKGNKPSSNSWVPVTFPMPFINTDYVVVEGISRNNGFNWESEMVGFDSVTTSGIRFAVWKNRQPQYVAIGYWK